MFVDKDVHIGEEFGIYRIESVAPNKTKDGHKLYNAVCKECGFIKTARYQKLKNKIISVCTHKHEYKKSFCLFCKKEIPIENLQPSVYNKRKFCSCSCATLYNNLQKDRKKKYCLNCGKEIPRQNKYCSNNCQHEHKQKEWEEKWLSGELSGNIGSKWCDISGRVRTYLFKKYNNKCAKCGWGEVNPYTNKIPLEVEHIDGNPYNTTPNNVTLLCPNCHSLTRTYKGANKGNGRKRTWIPVKLDKVTDTA